MEPQKKLLFQSLTEAIKKQQWEIAYLLASIENNSEKYDQHKNRMYKLRAHGTNPDEEINQLQKKMDIIADIQGKILITLQPLIDELFDQVAEEIPPGIGYNEALRNEIRFTLIFGERNLSWPMDGSRDTYRASVRNSTRQQNYEKRIQKNIEKRKKEKEKVWLPQDHQLLNEESYSKLKKTMWTYIDKVVITYQQKFLRDDAKIDQVRELLDHYFLFIIMEMLIQSKIVFDTKKPKSYPFFQQVLNDCLVYLQNKYKVTLSISLEDSKKKFFSTIDENTKPFDLIYKNCLPEDLIAREEYLNVNFFASNGTSVDQIRRKVNNERKQNIEKMKNWWILLNPLYHISVEKKEKILTTIAILESHKAENNLIDDLLIQLKINLEEAEENRKNSVVFEEDNIQSRELESINKLQLQQLKFYKVPVQYRKTFGLVVNKLNHFFQTKANLVKEINEDFEEACDKLNKSPRRISDILSFLNNLVTYKDIPILFDKKWIQKCQDHYRDIQSFFLGTQKITAPTNKNRKKKKKRIKNMQGQGILEFF